MDKLKLQGEIQALENLNEHLEQQLKLVGIELCDLPDDVIALLDNCVELQRATNLHDLSLNYLKDFYYTKKKEHIDNEMILAKQQSESKNLAMEIKENEREIAVLESFISSVNERLVSEAELERTILISENKKQQLLDRQSALMVPHDFNIDELIQKTQMLKTLKNTKEK